MTKNEAKRTVLGIFTEKFINGLEVGDMATLLGIALEEFPDLTKDICLQCFGYLRANSVTSYFEAVLRRALQYLIGQMKIGVVKVLIDEYPDERDFVITVICEEPNGPLKATVLKELAKQDLLSVPEIIRRHPELTLAIIETNPTALSLGEVAHIIAMHSPHNFEDRLEIMVSLAKKYPQCTPELIKGAGKDFYSAIVKVLAESVTGEE